MIAITILVVGFLIVHGCVYVGLSYPHDRPREALFHTIGVTLALAILGVIYLIQK